MRGWACFYKGGWVDQSFIFRFLVIGFFRKWQHHISVHAHRHMPMHMRKEFHHHFFFHSTADTVKRPYFSHKNKRFYNLNFLKMYYNIITWCYRMLNWFSCSKIHPNFQKCTFSLIICNTSPNIWLLDSKNECTMHSFSFST